MAALAVPARAEVATSATLPLRVNAARTLPRLRFTHQRHERFVSVPGAGHPAARRRRRVSPTRTRPTAFDVIFDAARRGSRSERDVSGSPSDLPPGPSA